MLQTQSGLLKAAEQHIADFYTNNVSANFVFHDLQHIRNVVESVLEISGGYAISDKELEILQLAAWFHDTGYSEGSDGHEERSCAHARDFLREHNYAEEDIEQVCRIIMATRVTVEPEGLLEKIMCDADVSHLGKKLYWDRCGRLRQELVTIRDVVMSEQEWVDFELNFLTNHQFHTEAAQMLYKKRKQKHIRQLRKLRMRLHPELMSEEPLSSNGKKKKKKKKSNNDDNELKDLRLGRGVETMYRSTYRTHINLSSIADNKANIMLSINAIIVSIVVSTLVPKFTDNPKLIIPTLILLTVCLIAIVFATLSTRPKVTEGKFTREDIEEKRSNLLFFGNYYSMDLEDFHWGMMEMIKDSDFLYSSMTRDLYYLGKVLALKYRYLSICYAVFMYGLIAAVIAFAVVFVFF